MQMLVERSQKSTLMEVVKTTFDGAHPCDLCKRIANNHDDERAPSQPLVKAKLDMFFCSSKCAHLSASVRFSVAAE